MTYELDDKIVTSMTVCLSTGQVMVSHIFHAMDNAGYQAQMICFVNMIFGADRVLTDFTGSDDLMGVLRDVSPTIFSEVSGYLDGDRIVL